MFAASSSELCRSMLSNTKDGRLMVRVLDVIRAFLERVLKIIFSLARSCRS
jgi:hypothetical protein